MTNALVRAGIGELDALLIYKKLQSGLVLTGRNALALLPDLSDQEMIDDARIGWWSSPGVEDQYNRLLDADPEGEQEIEDPLSVYENLPLTQWPTWLLERLYQESRNRWQALSERSLPDLPVEKSAEPVMDLLGRIDHPYPDHPAAILRLYLDSLEGKA